MKQLNRLIEEDYKGMTENYDDNYDDHSDDNDDDENDDYNENYDNNDYDDDYGSYALGEKPSKKNKKIINQIKEEIEQDTAISNYYYDENTPINLYNEKNIKTDDKDMTAVFIKLKNDSLSPIKEVKEQAYLDACRYTKGIVLQILRQCFSTYVKKDPSFRDDLINAAFCNIIANLPKYDPDKAVPSTYFYLQAKSGMTALTNSYKHHTKSNDSALKRKIMNLQKEYEKLGKKLTEADIMVEIPKTSLSKIRDILKLMSYSVESHLDSFDYDSTLEQPATGEYDNPEKIAIMHSISDTIKDRLLKEFSDIEVEFFFRNCIAQEKPEELAKDFRIKNFYNNAKGIENQIKNTIDKMKRTVQYDPDVRRTCGGYIKEDYDDNDIPMVNSILVNEQIDAFAEIPFESISVSL